MSDTEYFHGFSTEEHERLIRQADYWRDTLIPVDITWQSGDRVLEVGCAVGAALAVLAKAFPGIQVAGVDLESRQIDAASDYLSSRGIDADLRVADGSELPFEDASFDHVYMMWLLEHVRDVRPILAEARRVLRPGGTITLTETDYTTFKVTPESPDWDGVEEAQYLYFETFGQAIAGRQLGLWLSQAGFAEVTNRQVGHHFFQGGSGLKEHAEYVLGFLEPGVEQLVSLGYDETNIRRGLDWLRQVPHKPDGTFTQMVYRAQARKPE